MLDWLCKRTGIARKGRERRWRRGEGELGGLKRREPGTERVGRGRRDRGRRELRGGTQREREEEEKVAKDIWWTEGVLDSIRIKVWVTWQTKGGDH